MGKKNAEKRREAAKEYWRKKESFLEEVLGFPVCIADLDIECYMCFSGMISMLEDGSLVPEDYYKARMNGMLRYWTDSETEALVMRGGRDPPRRAKTKVRKKRKKLIRQKR